MTKDWDEKILRVEENTRQKRWEIKTKNISEMPLPPPKKKKVYEDN